MKRYGQRCPAARALDAIGDRWALLVVRELGTGPKRFTDLAQGLPGIGTNVLTARLAGLQEHGVIEKRTLAPPTPVTIYELTDAGRALAPVLRELRLWGQEHGPAPEPGDAVRAAWVLQSAAARPPGLGAGRTCEVCVDAEAFVLRGGDAGVDVQTGEDPTADAALHFDTAAFYALATGSPPFTRRHDVRGDERVADAVLRMLAGAAHTADERADAVAERPSFK